MEDGKYVDGSIWFYAPNKAAPVFFAVAFGASTICHAWQSIHYQSWRLTGLYVFCCTLFTAGFIAREMGAFDYGNLVKYIVSVCLVYAAPPLFELCNYNILGRILYFVPYHSPIHPGRVITTFAFVSAIVESLNGWGASYTANTSLARSQQEVGHALLKTALVLQLGVVASFLLLAGVFHRRCKRAGIRNGRVYSALHTLYGSSALLTARTVYRVVEYWSIAAIDFSAPGFDGSTLSPIVRYEWFFYVFEASLMICNAVLLNVRHPRKFLPKSTKTYLAPPDGVEEVTGPGYKDTRPFIMTVLDPFDLRGLIQSRKTGGKKEDRFWENPGGVTTEESRGSKKARSHADLEAGHA